MFDQARVVATYPGTHRIDCVSLRTGKRMGGVILSAAALASDCGSFRVPDTSGVDPAAAAQLNTDGTERNVIALVAPIAGGGFVCMGFLPPNGGQIAPQEQNRWIDRHPSGSYTTVAPDGSVEVWHASGSYFRIGTGGHQDLAGVAGAAWKNPTPAAAPTVTLETPNFTLQVDTGGNATMTYTSLTMNGPVTHKGDWTSSGTITGQIDVVADGISGKGHVHGGVQPGSATTTGPEEA